LTRFGVLQDLNETARFIQNDAVSSIQEKKKGKGQNGVVLNDTVHLSSSPPNMQRGRREKWCFFLKFLPAPLSRLEPTDRTQWPTTHRAPPTEPRQPRPMADQPAAPRESCKKQRPWPL
jgi:hypothetical protein